MWPNTENRKYEGEYSTLQVTVQYSNKWTRSSDVAEKQAMLCVTEYLAISHSRSLKVIRNDTLEYGMCKSISVFRCNYLVPFLRYSALNNGVPLKSGLGSFGVIENGTIRQIANEFLLVFHIGLIMALSCSIFEIKRYIAGKLRFFHTPSSIDT